MFKDHILNNLTDEERELLKFVDSLRIEEKSLEEKIKGMKVEEQEVLNRKIVLDNQVLSAGKELSDIKNDQFTEKETRLKSLDERELELGLRGDKLDDFEVVLNEKSDVLDGRQSEIDALEGKLISDRTIKEERKKAIKEISLYNIPKL